MGLSFSRNFTSKDGQNSEIRIMVLEHLHLLHFKNHEGSDLTFGAEVNCLLGDNGSGKTNVLDAVHYLCHTKSYFNPIDGQNIAHGEQHMLIQGTLPGTTSRKRSAVPWSAV